jgi:hypothetical protein
MQNGRGFGRETDRIEYMYFSFLSFVIKIHVFFFSHFCYQIEQLSRPDPPRPDGTRARSGRTTRPCSFPDYRKGGIPLGDRPRQLWVINRPGPFRVANMGLNPTLQSTIGRPIIRIGRPIPACGPTRDVTPPTNNSPSSSQRRRRHRRLSDPAIAVTIGPTEHLQLQLHLESQVTLLKQPHQRPSC